jgi:hypothetical protein
MEFACACGKIEGRKIYLKYKIHIGPCGGPRNSRFLLKKPLVHIESDMLKVDNIRMSRVNV